MKLKRKIALISVIICMLASALVGGSMLVRANQIGLDAHEKISYICFINANPGLNIVVHYYSEGDNTNVLFFQESSLVKIPYAEFMYMIRGFNISITYYFNNEYELFCYTVDSYSIDIEPHGFTCWLLGCNHVSDSSRRYIIATHGACFSYCMRGNIYNRFVCSRCGSEAGFDRVGSWTVPHNWSLSTCRTFASCHCGASISF